MGFRVVRAFLVQFFYVFVEDAGGSIMPCCIVSIASRTKIAVSKTKSSQLLSFVFRV